MPSDLHLGKVQMSEAPGGEALYLDDVVTNAGNSRITGAVAEVGFHDSRGNLIASRRAPIVGMAPGGTDIVRNEFVKQPIGPKQVRFFRIAIDQVPPARNHEVPDVTVVEVKAK